MDVMALKQLEHAGAFNRIEGYLAGDALASRDAAAFKYGSAYYVRRGKPAKSLECYSHYLAFEKAAEPDAEAISLAIDCARRLEKNALVRDYFFSLNPKAREKLPTATLLSVSEALIALNQLDEAEKIIAFMRYRSGSPQLMSFDAIIEQKFGNLAATRQYIARNAKELSGPDAFQNVQQALTLALAYMANGNFNAAENVLTNCKAGVAA